MMNKHCRFIILNALALGCLLILCQVTYAQEPAEINESQIRILIQGLGSSSDDIINKSAGALAQIGKPVIPYLFEAYAKPISDRQRNCIIFAATCLEDKEIAELLLKYLEDEHRRIGDYYDALMRAEAKRSKSDIFGDSVENVRAPQLNYDVRIMAINQLGKLRESRAVPLFLKAIRMPAPPNSALKPAELTIKQRITRMLSRFIVKPFPDPQIIGCLMELLADKDNETMRWALYGLQRAGYQASPEQAKKLLAGYDVGILEYALALLENSEDESLPKILKKPLDNSSPFVRSCARATLRVICNESPAISPTLTAEELPVAREFSYPLREYLKDSGRKSFGAKIDSKMILRPDAQSFGNSIHLGDDCGWYQDGAPIYAIADGLVRSVKIIPSMTDESGQKMWGWGGRIIIEHKTANKVKTETGIAEEIKYICSLYAHMNVSVREGELVKKGQKIGAIGIGFSPENGDYEAHLHFSIHDGAYGVDTGQPAPWIGGYNSVENGTKGWIDPLKFLQSKVR